MNETWEPYERDLERETNNISIVYSCYPKSVRSSVFDVAQASRPRFRSDVILI